MSIISKIQNLAQRIGIEFINIKTPIGTIIAYAGNTIPENYLLCDGSVISRITYADLFSVIGTTYGEGDGSTTFNLPNLINKFIEGSQTSGTEIPAGLPNLYGDFHGRKLRNGVEIHKSDNTLFKLTNENAEAVGLDFSTNSTWSKITFDASSYNPIYGNSDTVQPPAVTMKYLIKY